MSQEIPYTYSRELLVCGCIICALLWWTMWYMHRHITKEGRDWIILVGAGLMTAMLFYAALTASFPGYDYVCNRIERGGDGTIEFYPTITPKSWRDSGQTIGVIGPDELHRELLVVYPTYDSPTHLRLPAERFVVVTKYGEVFLRYNIIRYQPE